MSDLVAFYSARLDEEEAAAKAAPGSAWRAFTQDDIAGASVYDEQWVLLYPEHYDHDNKLSARPGATGPAYIERSRNELAAHIARHDPARVLREVDAKRKILALHHDDLWNADDDPDTAHCAECTTDDDLYKPQMYPCQTVRLLAAVHDGHPDYDAAWAPA